MPEIKPLQTKRKNSKWVAYTSMASRNINQTIDISATDQELLQSPACQRYLQRQYENIADISPERRETEHDPGYHRSIVLPFVTTVAGTAATLAGLFSTAIGKRAHDEETGDYFSIALSGMGILATTIGLTLTIINFRVNYKNIQSEREYNHKVAFIQRLPSIRAEIKLKEKVLRNFSKIINNLNCHSSKELIGITQEYALDSNTLDKLAAILDSYDDLTIYEKLDKSLFILNKASYLKEYKELLDDLISIVKNRAKNKYERMNIGIEKVEKTTTIDDLLSFAPTGVLPSKNIEETAFEVSTFIFKEVIALLDNLDKLKAVKSILSLIESKELNECVLKESKQNIIVYTFDMIDKKMNTNNSQKNVLLIQQSLSTEKNQSSKEEELDVSPYELKLIKFLQEQDIFSKDIDYLKEDTIFSIKDFFKILARKEPTRIKYVLTQLINVLEGQQLFDAAIQPSNKTYKLQ